MPHRRNTIREIVGISTQTELIIMTLIGMTRNAMDSISFSWNNNVQKIWDLPGPEPSFSAKYHFDYWLKTVLSFVVWFRNSTTHIHLVLYVVMMYSVLTGKRPSLMLPWLWLQMLKNITTDIICLAVGVLLCLFLHSCGILALEFLVVGILSMMPSIYLWRRLRAYYNNLYYAQIDGLQDPPIPREKYRGFTLAQRRRASKSIDGTIPLIIAVNDRPRIGSCVTYDEFFGPPNWEEKTDKEISKSLTTLLTTESQDSDEIEEDSCLKIIEDENLTPAEKTLRILGMTREESEPNETQFSKTTSTDDFEENKIESLDSFTEMEMRLSLFTIVGAALEPRTVGLQVNLESRQRKEAPKIDGKLNQKGIKSKKCVCCEETKCADDDSDSNSDEDESERLRKNKSDRGFADRSNCCDRNRPGNTERDKEVKTESENKKNSKQSGKNFEAVSTGHGNYEHDFRSANSCMQAVVERDGIEWKNFREINFVSVIKKSLCGQTGSFKLQRHCEDVEKIGTSEFAVDESRQEVPKNSFEDGAKFENDSSLEKIIPEREDGTKFIDRINIDCNFGKLFSGPKSASFGADSEVLALNASDVFKETLNRCSDVQSFDSTRTNVKQLIRPDQDICSNSYFKSSFQRHSDMLNDSRDARENFEPTTKTPRYRIDNYNSWELGPKTFAGNEIDRVRDSYEIIKSSKEPFFNSQAHQGMNISYKLSPTSKMSLIKRQSINGEKNFSPSFVSLKKSPDSSRPHPTKDDYAPPAQPASQSFSKMTDANFETMNKSGNGSEAFLRNDKRMKNDSVTSRENGLNDRRFLTSSSRSSRSGKVKETPEEREEKMMQALKAYNAKTLLEYKKELDARKSQGTSFSSTVHDVEETFSRPPNQQIGNELDPLKSTASTCGIYFKQGNRVSVPGFVVPEKELIFNIDNAYGKLTRSKPADSTTNAGLGGNRLGKDIFDTYSGGGSQEMQKIKIGDETSAMRKQLSKYSKFVRGKNYPADITNSGSCKRIEGLQRGRDLDRILAREDIRSQNVEVHFPERTQTGELPSTSENLSLRTIKSFSRNQEVDIGSAASSDILTSEAAQNPAVSAASQNDQEINLNLQEEINGQRHVVEKSLPKSMKEAINLIDWSFQRPIPIEGSFRKTRESCNNLTRTMPRSDRSPEHHDMFYKNTANILQFAFVNDENSERGFFVEESSDDFTLSIEEFVTNVAFGDYREDFVCQPGTEELANENFDEGFSVPNFKELTVDTENLYKKTKITSEQVRLALQDVIDRSLRSSLNLSHLQGSGFNSSGIMDHFNGSGKEIQSIVLKFFDEFPICKTFLKYESSSLGESVQKSLTGSEFPTGFETLIILNAAQSMAGKMMKTVEQTTSVAGENGRPEIVENFTDRPSTSGNVNFGVDASTGNDDDGWSKNGSKKNPENRRVVIDADSVQGSETSSVERINESFENCEKRLLKNFSSESVISSLSDSLKRQNFRRNVIVSVFMHAINNGGSQMGVLEADQELGESQSVTGSYRDNYESRREAVEIVRVEKETEMSEIKKGAFSIATADNATHDVVQIGIIENTSSKKTPENSQPNTERSLIYSSWDKIIPKSKRKSIVKTKKVTTDQVSFRRVIKVVKLIEDKSLDFFSARPVPQRGRGLSSGYLMDSDSDGNLTVSRPPSPVSVDSISSQNSYENEPEIPTGNSKNLSNSVAAHESPYKSRSLSIIDVQGPSTVRPVEFRILGSETLPTSSRLRHLSLVDAAGIETKLKDVMRQIFRHQSTAGHRKTSGLLTVSKTASLISISIENKMADPSIDLQSNIGDAEEEVVQIIDGILSELIFTPATKDSNLDSAFEITPRKSKVSVKHAANGTEYNIEVFKDLVELFTKFHGIGSEILTGQVSSGQKVEVIDSNYALNEELPSSENLKSVENERENMVMSLADPENNPPEFASYDSFDSNYSKSKLNQLPNSSSRQNSISDHTFLEDFPEDQSLEQTSATHSLNSTGSESNAPTSNDSNGEHKKGSSSKKTGIPRPVKGSR